jgi:tetratricopeptide (TPR) repeat protein
MDISPLRLKTFVFVALFLGAVSAMAASQSNVLAYAAEKSYTSGDLLGAWSKYQRALLLAQKEADTTQEVGLVLNMAQIQADNEDFTLTDSLLSHLKYGLNESQNERFWQIKAQTILNFQFGFNNDDLKSKCKIWLEKAPNKSPLNLLYHSACLTQVGLISEAKKVLELSQKRWPENSGMLAWFWAHHYNIQGKTQEALPFLLKALERSQKASQFVSNARLLEQIALTYQILGQTEMVADFSERSALVYERLGLVKPFERNAKRALNIQPNIPSLILGLQKIPQ